MDATAGELSRPSVASQRSQRDSYTLIRSSKWQFVILAAILVLAIVAAYLPVHHYPFLQGVDDNGYVYENPRVLGPLDWTEIKWEFTHPFLLNYDPLTFLGHSINVRLFQLNAGRHHDSNVFLHVVNGLLLFWLLRRATGSTGRSFMVAALFAVHPINVENVAWIAELKTLLSTVFFFLALGAYRWYAQRPKLWRMLWVSFLYGLGLLAKPQIITLPFVLLLWDYWPLRRMFGAQATERNPADPPSSRFYSLILEKWPLFVIAVVDALITIHVGGHKEWIERYTFSIRLGAAIRSFVVYLGKAFWPVNLAFNYPHPGYSLRWLGVWASLVLLLAITAVVLVYRQHRYLVVGWFWFLGTMVPMINLVQIDISAVADRYAYICFVGLFLMVCWGTAEFARQKHLPRAVLPVAAAATLIFLAVLTRVQVRYWSDAEAVWKRSIEVAPRNGGSEWALGNLLIGRGHIDEGMKYMYLAMEDRPQDASVPARIAFEEHQQGHLKPAIFWYQKALAMSKDGKLNAQLYANMGHAYGDLGDAANALRCYREAQRTRGTLPKDQQ